MGNLFGKLCRKVGKKAVVAFSEYEMVFKLGKADVDRLLDQYKGSQKFDPSKKGRPKKDWIQIPAAYQSAWKTITAQAIQFLTS